ncbi:MAG: cytochrome c maturation protein CcmE [Parvibaculales bacterium]
MTPKQIRLAAIGGGLAFLALAAFIALTALEDNIVFFRSPSELAAKPAAIGEAIRIGGLVREGSVTRDGLRADFQVTDLAHDIAVSYEGMLPDLFREGQGVVAEGRFDATGTFRADTVLAKHDETYMPPEVAEALEKSGKYNAPHPTKDAP